METKELKKIMRALKLIYAELEAEAFKEGLDIASPDYDKLVQRAREVYLAKHGYTNEEYSAAKAKLEQISSTILKGDKGEKGDTGEKGADSTVPGPRGPKGDRGERGPAGKDGKDGRDGVAGLDGKDGEDIPETTVAYLEEKIGSIKEYDDTEIRDWVKDYFGEQFEHNIDTLGMPDFRKLGMGLQAQIDTKIEGVGVNRIFYATTEPANMVTGDIWIQPA